MRWLWHTLGGYWLSLMILSLGASAVIYWAWLAEAMREVAQ
jgi:hypothetical protein